MSNNKSTTDKGGVMTEPSELEEIREIISFAILDGQNQVHDLKDGKATPEEINDRMFRSSDYFTEKATHLIQQEKNKARISELKQLRPPEQYKEYAVLMGSEACTICGFNSEVFRKHIDERIAQLKSVEIIKGRKG